MATSDQTTSPSRANENCPRRVLCVRLPHLATDRARLAQAGGENPDLARANPAERRPLVLTRTVGSSRQVLYACPLARELGIQPGITLAQAGALAPRLLALDHAEHADWALLLRLADQASAFSPIVEPVAPDALLIDITGMRRMLAPAGGRVAPDWRADRLVAQQALGGLMLEGLHARAAVADTVGAAYALAWASREPLVVAADGESVRAIAPLPAESLRIPERAAARLDAVGVRTIGDLLMLPRASLAPRFGSALVHRLQQALGEIFEPIVAFCAEHPPAAELAFEFAVRQRQALLAVADRLLGDVLRQVLERERALRRLDGTLTFEDGEPLRLSVAFSRPAREFPRVAALLHARLDAADLRAGVTAMRLTATQTERWYARQQELFEPPGAAEDERFGELVDRLIGRLGHDAVVAASLLDDYQPEHAYRYSPVGDAPANVGPCPAAAPSQPRPIQLFRDPQPVEVVSLVPDGPPARMTYRGRVYRVRRAWGPERIETAWWRGRDVRRDYFRVCTESGDYFWLFYDLDAGCWRLHGIFA